MKFLWATIVVFAAIHPLPAQTQMDCTINHVDPVASTVTLQRGAQAGIFKVAAAAAITLDGARASLSDLKLGMHVRITTSSPDTVASIEASGPATSANSPAPPAGEMDAPADTLKADITIPAKDPEGYQINNLRKGTELQFRYVSGAWKNHGHIAQFNPDDAKTPDESRLALALPGKGKDLGAVLVVIPADTQKRAFIFKVDQDYPTLTLRINAAPSPNPGQVKYAVTIIPPPR